MPATTHLVESNSGEILTRTSSSRIYAYAVLVMSPRIPSWKEGHNPADLSEGVWGWSADRVNADKAARAARKAWPTATIRIVPALRVQQTTPEFANGAADMAWHVVDSAGNVVRYGRTKAELLEPAPKAVAPAPSGKTPLRAVRISDELWQAAGAKAAERGESLSDVIRRALEQY